MILDFATKRRKKNTKNCKKGYNCGNSCINKRLKCKRKFSDQASTYAGWLKKQAERQGGGDTKQKTKSKSVKAKGELKPSLERVAHGGNPQDRARPLTDQERSDPKKLIEVGKAFAAKYNLDKASSEAEAYEKARAKHYEAEDKRLDKRRKEGYKLDEEAEKLGNEALAAWEREEFDKSDELSEKQRAMTEEAYSLKFGSKRAFFDKHDELALELSKLPDNDQLERRHYNNPEKLVSEKSRIGGKRQELEKQLEKAIAKQPGRKSFNQALEAVKQNSPLSKAQAKNVYETQARKITPLHELYDKRIEVANDFTDIIQLTGDPPKDLVLNRTSDRASAKNIQDFASAIKIDDNGNPILPNLGVRINVGNEYERNTQAKKVMFHEYSHSVEYRHQEIAEANIKWVKNRATSDKPQKLSELTGNSEYDDRELAYPDAFADAYVGKIYEEANRGFKATETLSFGAEHFVSADKTKELFQKDPEHYYLTLGSIIEVQNKNRK